MVHKKISRIRHQLSDHNPDRVVLEDPMRAAVALLLQPQEEDLHVLFIHRAHHPHDPWSGHMAFPGGRKDPEDPDLLVTISRETREEVGIDLDLHGEYLGRLTEVQAMARGKLTNMAVSPFVYLVSSEAQPEPDPVEVQDTIWVPLSFMQRDGVERTVRRDLPDQTTIEVPALVYGGKTIWGLTYRVLRDFLGLIREHE
ncbi:MAG: CoA pyrophosphatase [Deltaproteobacteria bacterium]|nr:CoA pyrophosphatase [Deltaproteobacteria bacterium]